MSNAAPVKPADHQVGQVRCSECGGWTFDPAFHSERYRHDFHEFGAARG